jgi:hypothetical protein
MFLAGLLCLWAVHMTFAWWANVLYLLALRYYCRGDDQMAARRALTATGLALSWTLLTPHEINSPAFLLWSGSMAILAIGSLGLARMLPRKSTEHPAPIGWPG